MEVFFGVLIFPFFAKKLIRQRIMEEFKNTTGALRSKFIDSTYDRGFHLLMMDRDCPELTLEFLRAIIPERDIVSIEFRPTDSVPGREEDKRKNYDIYCTDAEGNIFIVEMQREPYRSYGDRLVVYAGDPATGLTAEQVERL